MYQKPIEIRARLRKPYYANFLDYFHDNSNEDHFYKILQNKCSNHLIKSKILETNYKYPFNNEGFYFKNDNIKCYDKNGTECLIEDCIDRDVVMKLTIINYDFTDKERIVGCCIKVKKISIKADK